MAIKVTCWSWSQLKWRLPQTVLQTKTNLWWCLNCQYLAYEEKGGVIFFSGSQVIFMKACDLLENYLEKKKKKRETREINIPYTPRHNQFMTYLCILEKGEKKRMGERDWAWSRTERYQRVIEITTTHTRHLICYWH